MIGIIPNKQPIGIYTNAPIKNFFLCLSGSLLKNLLLVESIFDDLVICILIAIVERNQFDVFRLLRYMEENMENNPKFCHNPYLKLIDQVREVLRYHHYAYRTETSYCQLLRIEILSGTISLYYANS